MDLEEQQKKKRNVETLEKELTGIMKALNKGPKQFDLWIYLEVF